MILREIGRELLLSGKRLPASVLMLGRGGVWLSGLKKSCEAGKGGTDSEGGGQTGFCGMGKGGDSSMPCLLRGESNLIHALVKKLQRIEDILRGGERRGGTYEKKAYLVLTVCTKVATDLISKNRGREPVSRVAKVSGFR